MIFDRAVREELERDRIEEGKQEDFIEKRMRNDEEFAIEQLGLVEACEEVNKILEKLNKYGHLCTACDWVD